MKTRVLGTGHYLPERILTNRDIEQMVETSDQWIVERTGIKERRITPPGLSTSDLALIASRNALAAAGITSKDLDAIFFATVTPDQPMPNTACVLQAKLGANPVFSWDLSAACSGFLYALSVADKFIKAKTHKRILVVGAETLSRIVNYRDRETCILFGDGAGAWVVGPGELEETSEILSEDMHADGNLGDLLVLPAGGSRIPYTHEILDQGRHFMTMKGKEIFKNAVRTMSKCAENALAKAGKTIADVKWFVPHQANQRILEATAKHMDFPMEKVIINLDKTGNTSAASVPIAFDQAVRDGRVQRGDLILIAVFGAGLTSGATLIRY